MDMNNINSMPVFPFFHFLVRQCLNAEGYEIINFHVHVNKQSAVVCNSLKIATHLSCVATYLAIYHWSENLFYTFASFLTLIFTLSLLQYLVLVNISVRKLAKV